ncbi:dolichol phosphate-mannose biosynthesis regulatory protein-like [Pomacea canaliculata]|uniref:dolichol phosphate-mannose biosynthesis regulatory protein-like n=1 Tax=Pomacea canaliculata TaxID=400727 RepID=UPI000D73F6E4|nr:dolichol phosphate-mannose biosynthesis regulatory protein-like [Pomacea canaliculata]
MPTGHDQLAGWGMVSFASFIFIYYTVWVIVLPFVEPGIFIHKLFPPRIYAIAGPLVAGVVALLLLGSFVSYVTFKSKMKKS